MGTMFDSVFADTATESTLSVSNFLVCMAAALVMGAIFSVAYSYRSRYTKSFVMTLFLLPATVAVVIMMVNGNIGAGVAVTGAFSLVRFRSVPGTAKEIAALFMAMGSGLICGMGYIGYAAVFSIILGCCMVIFQASGLGGAAERDKVLNITIPEDLNYSEVFDEDLAHYTSDYELVSVKTTNMGSLFKLSYHIRMKDTLEEKNLIDALRCKNGNLEISIMRMEAGNNEL